VLLPTASFGATGITHVEIVGDRLRISGSSEAPNVEILELQAHETSESSRSAKSPLASGLDATNFQLELPRWTDKRDRAYSSFVLTDREEHAIGSRRYVEDFSALKRNEEPFPTTESKKGLQVQMLDDALALGVKHAALNVNLSSLVALTNGPGSLTWTNLGGAVHYFEAARIQGLDRQVKKLSDAGVVVSLIILAYESSRPEITRLLLDPLYDRKAPNRLGAFNTSTAEGVDTFAACMEFLAERYCRDQRFGRAVNFIIGNELNSHWFWYNMGPATMEQVADHYLRAVRICNTAIRKYSAHARVYLSLEHHWNIRYPGGNAMQAFAGRPFLEYFNRSAKAHGDFDWQIAFHPYPENLFDCRTWKDKSATLRNDTPRITFKNLEMLISFLGREDMLYRGTPRRIILSEQGFHSTTKPDGEQLQAAAYAYAYYRIDHMPGIDAFILHRQVDHPAEGGLNLGLWKRDPNGKPTEKKQIYEVFRHADMPDWEQTFEFALPIIGIKSWPETLPH